MSWLEPDSRTLLVLLLLLAVGGLVLVLRLRRWPVRCLAGALVIVSSAVAGMATVNDYYGYYQTWAQLGADLSGNYAAYDAAPAAARVADAAGHGRVERVEFAGARSRLDRPGFVYLPPQYFEARFARTRFPVVELVHGTPGTPADWLVHLHVAEVLDRLIAAHLMGPVIVVMPTMSVGRTFEECVDGPRGADDTYLTDDIRTDVLARYRASPVPAEWGIAGYSSGGYCAADLALRHPAAFGASAIMDGYFRPTDGPAAAALGFDPAAERANDPLLAARQVSVSAPALPSFWVAAGSGDRADLAAARAFAAALHGVERVTLYRQPGAAHNFYAWSAAVPRALQWLWTQLTPPELRVRFPVSGPVGQAVIVAPTFGYRRPGSAVHSCGPPCGHSVTRSNPGKPDRSAAPRR
jgi:enterochelin esterase-like enzyme